MIIGVVGFISSGKGTVADILVQENNFKKLSFADPVKDVAAAVFGWSRSSLEGDTEKSREFREKPDKYWSDKFGKDFSPRLALQKIGTELFRDGINQNIWVHALERRLNTTIVDPTEAKIIIPDTRFPNEIQFIQENQGKVVRVKRGPEPAWWDAARTRDHETMSTKFPDVHYSEWAWCTCVPDYVIENNGTRDDLKKQVKEMLNFYFEPATI